MHIKDHITFPTDEHERKFKHCLTKTPTLARIYTDDDGNQVLAIRPKDIPKFRFVLSENGLGNCEVSAKVLKLIESLPTEFIRFVHKKRERK